MLVISNNIMPELEGLKAKPVIRINIAWVHSVEKLREIIERWSQYDVLLDYPTGRTKPPKPKLSIETAISLSQKYEHIKYFSVSNVENSEEMKKLKSKLLPRIKIIPKIETPKGVHNIIDIMTSAETDIAMLDKEDLYTALKCDQDKYEHFVLLARASCYVKKLHLIELEGVVFREHI